MGVIVATILNNNMKNYFVFQRQKSGFYLYLGFLLGFLLLILNLTKVQAQTVPLDYDLHRNDTSNPVTFPDETINNNDNSAEELSENQGSNSQENNNEPIMIFVPPPDRNGQINVNPPRKNLADLLIIQPMLIP